MKVDLKKQLETRSFRVKGIDVHPTEPLIAVSLYTGTLQLWNYETQQLIRSVEVSSTPARTVRFIARKNWVAVGSDDLQIRVFSISNLERVAQFEAHQDYVRALCVHPTLPVLLSASDDMLIKMWDWERQFECTQVFKGHESYVLGLAINPKDPTQFASGSMDRTVKVWKLDSGVPSYTLEAHDEKGVNYVEYYPLADKPYLLTASDDRTIRIFDYQSKQVVATLTGHTHNVSFATWHPQLPLIISGSEDSTLKLWNARSYKLEQTLNFGMERAWCVGTKPQSNLVVAGFETGALVLKLGRDEPVASLDLSGKLVWAKQLEAFSASIRQPAPQNGGIVHLPTKDLGAIEMQPSLVRHSPDGRYVAVAGDNDIVVYTALAWRSKFFQAGVDFCWGPDTACAVLTAAGEVQIRRQFREHLTVSVPNARRVFGGEFLSVLVDDEVVSFYDWRTGAQVAVLAVSAREIVWDDSGLNLAVITELGAHILRVDLEKIEEGLAQNETDLVSAFTEVCELSREPVRSATWVGDCFVYTTYSNRLNYLVGTQSHTLSHYDRDMYVLRYLPRDGVVYLCDKDLRVRSQELSLAVIEFQTAVLRNDLDEAMATLLPRVPKSELVSVARFLESEQHPRLALQITPDEQHRFDLALVLNDLDLAAQIAKPEEVVKWRQLGDGFLAQFNIDRATDAYRRAGDLDTLLLVYSSTNDWANLRELAEQAQRKGKNNLAFNALWAAGDTPAIEALLNKTGRHAEAALFALTYGDDFKPSVAQWKQSLVSCGRANIAERIEMPEVEKEKMVEPVEEMVKEKGEKEEKEKEIVEPVQDEKEKEIVEPVQDEKEPVKEKNENEKEKPFKNEKSKAKKNQPKH